MRRETHLSIQFFGERSYLVGIVSFAKLYYFFFFSFLLTSISNDQVRTCESNPGRKIDVTVDQIRRAEDYVFETCR